MIRYLLVNVKAPNFYTLTIHNYPFNIIHAFFLIIRIKKEQNQTPAFLLLNSLSCPQSSSLKSS